MYFWHNEHKLGISTLVLVRLYRAAKDAFIESYKRYKMSNNSQFMKAERLDDNASMCSTSFLDFAEIEVMRHSRALLLLSCDFGTAWNSRYVFAPFFAYASIRTSDKFASLIFYCQILISSCTNLQLVMGFTPNIFWALVSRLEPWIWYMEMYKSSSRFVYYQVTSGTSGRIIPKLIGRAIYIS